MTLPEQVEDEPVVSYIQLIQIVQNIRQQGQPILEPLLAVVEQELTTMREIILNRRP